MNFEFKRQFSIAMQVYNLLCVVLQFKTSENLNQLCNLNSLMKDFNFSLKFF